MISAMIKDDIVEVLDSLYRIFAASGKVFAQIKLGATLRLEMEQRLTATFCRISIDINSEKSRVLILRLCRNNLGTISNGTNTYVSRRFVTKIKQLFGIAVIKIKR